MKKASTSIYFLLTILFQFSLSAATPAIASMVDGGVLSIENDGGTSIDICAGDDVSDAFGVDLIDTMGTMHAWVITDPDGKIIGLPTEPPFDLEDAGAGVCQIWSLSYDAPLTGLLFNGNVADLTGTYDFSNPITVTRSEVEGGNISLDNGETTVEICAGDGVADPLGVNLDGSQIGENFSWVITDPQRNILALPSAPPFDLEGAGAGVCLIWGLSYNGTISNLAVDENTDNLEGCFALSNSISVKRNAVNGGMLTTTSGQTELAICATDGQSDAFNVTLSGNTGLAGDWVITSPSGEILAIPATPPFDLEGAGSGTCQVWFLAYFDNVSNLAVGNNVSMLEGCYDFSNPITVNRDGADAGMIALPGGGTETTICAGDGIPDPLAVELDAMQGGINQWVITDPNSIILGLPAGPPFDLEGAGAGQCLIWHISHCAGVTGIQMGENLNNISGDYEISNSITVNRIGVAGGDLTLAGGGTDLAICAGDGIADPFDVSISGNMGTNSAWVITDPNGIILGLPMAPPFDLDGAGNGTCFLQHLSYEDGLTGLAMGNNVAGLDGCHVFSNAITVMREDPFGGQLSFDNGTIEVDICAGDGMADPLAVLLNGNIGSNSTWVITDPDSNILALPAAPPFDLEGAGGGTCLIFNISYGDGLTGLVGGQNLQNLDGCFDLSNRLKVIREGVNGGMLTLPDGTIERDICANDGLTDAFNVNLTANLGANGAWVVTDSNGNILGVPPSPPFDLEGAGQGTCLIRYIAYGDGLSGLTVGNNVDELEGCYDFSNPITINREAPEGGQLMLPMGGDETTICAGDGVADPITPILMNEIGSESAWIITNTSGEILGLPAAPPFDLEGAGGGTCMIWHLSYGGPITGLAVGQNTNNLTGCLALSNPITINRTGVNGGALATMSGATDLSICANDGNSDMFNVTLSGNEGANSGWIITAPNGLILGTPPSPPFDLEGAGQGVCQIWHISYEDGLTGLMANNNVSDLNGCFALSNPITVEREAPEGGQLMLPSGTTVLDICAGDGISDAFTPSLLNNIGSESAWIITDANGEILGLPAGPPFDLEGAGGGTCMVWHLSYGGAIEGLSIGENTNNLSGCLSLSTPITVNRTGVAGGTLATDSGATEIDICAGDGISDAFNVTLSDNIGTESAWVITDTDGNILGLPMAPPFDLDGAGVGTCLIRNLSYETGLVGLMMGNNVADLDGCHAFSNPITVNRYAATGGTIEIMGGGVETTICAGDGVSDAFDVTLSGNSGNNSGWVITDTDGNILGLPMAPPFNLEGAGGGTCFIWHISYADGLTGMEVGMNTADFSGCYELSNAIKVNRAGVNGGDLATTSGQTNISICVNDGMPDPIDVDLTGNEGAGFSWVITDADGEILGLPAAPPFDLEGAGVGVCYIRNISFQATLSGLTVGQNISGVNGCYALSNRIEVSRTENVGGSLEILGGGDQISICAGDGVSDAFDVSLADNIGENSAWVITDIDGIILGLPMAPPFDLEGAGAGQCFVWQISYANGLSGLTMGANVNDLEGCHDFSNAITVDREGVDGGDLVFDNGSTEVTICVGDGIADLLDPNITGAIGPNTAWLITDEAGNIVGLPAAPPFDLEGAEAGVCQIWNISYQDGLTGLAMDANLSALNGCYSLSNPLTVTRVSEGMDCTSSTKDFVDHAAFDIHPNPTEGLVSININRSFTGKIDLRLLDVSGRVIVAKQTSALTESMDLSHLAAGVYFVELSNEFFVGTKRIVKQ